MGLYEGHHPAVPCPKNSPKEAADFSCLLRLRRLRALPCARHWGLVEPKGRTAGHWGSGGLALVSAGQLCQALRFSFSALGLPAQLGPGRLPPLPSSASAQLLALGGSIGLPGGLELGVWPLALGMSGLAGPRGTELVSLFLGWPLCLLPFRAFPLTTPDSGSSGLPSLQLGGSLGFGSLGAGGLGLGVLTQITRERLGTLLSLLTSLFSGGIPGGGPRASVHGEGGPCRSAHEGGSSLGVDNVAFGGVLRVKGDRSRLMSGLPSGEPLRLDGGRLGGAGSGVPFFGNPLLSIPKLAWVGSLTVPLIPCRRLLRKLLTRSSSCSGHSRSCLGAGSGGSSRLPEKVGAVVLSDSAACWAFSFSCQHKKRGQGQPGTLQYLKCDVCSESGLKRQLNGLSRGSAYRRPEFQHNPLITTGNYSPLSTIRCDPPKTKGNAGASSEFSFDPDPGHCQE